MLKEKILWVRTRREEQNRSLSETIKEHLLIYELSSED